MHSRQEVRRVHYINKSGYLATVKPSIQGVQILSSSESGGAETRKEPSQMVLSEGLKLPRATAGGETLVMSKQAGCGAEEKPSMKGQEAPLVQYKK